MKIERLKKDNHKLVIGGLIAFCLIAVTITYIGTRAKYQNTEIIPLVNGVVNYKAYDFKVMAMYQQKEDSDCTEDSCYNTITSMPETGYTINESKSYCTVDNKTHSNAKLYTNNLGEHVFSKISKNDKCYIWFDEIKLPLTINDIVADATTKITDFSAVETGAGGKYQADDPMYGSGKKTTYFRGAVTNNWVKFGGHFWRIIRKNGDGTLRLIYSGTAAGNNASAIPNVTIEGNGAVATGTGTQITVGGTNIFAYVTSNTGTNVFPAYVGWTYKTGSARPSTTNNSGSGASAAPTNADTAPSSATEYRSTAYETALLWFNSNISAADQAKVDAGKFCNDRMTQDNSNPAYSNTTATYYFAASGRLETNKEPTLACTNAGDVYTTKVGLITADEVAYAGGVRKQANQSYYLYTNQYNWTMSPYIWYYDSTTGRYVSVFFLHGNGKLDWTLVHATNVIGLRPVINLKADTQFSSDGNGTYNSPYIVI